MSRMERGREQGLPMEQTLESARDGLRGLSLSRSLAERQPDEVDNLVGDRGDLVEYTMHQRVA
jgi:hypothetical protein